MAAIAQPPPSAISSTDSALKRDRLLPAGACNFRHLASGSNAPLCGCRRFWDSTFGSNTEIKDPSSIVAQNGWCMCGHHACFHDMESGPQQISATNISPMTAASRFAIGHQVSAGGVLEHGYGLSAAGENMQNGFPNGQLCGSGREGLDSRAWPPIGDNQHSSSKSSPRDEPGIMNEKLKLTNLTQDRLSSLRIQRTGSVLSPPGGTSQLPPIPSQCLLRPGELEPLKIRPSFQSRGGSEFDGSRSRLSTAYGQQERELGTPTERIEDDTLRLLLAAQPIDGISRRRNDAGSMDGSDQKKHLNPPTPIDGSALNHSRQHDRAVSGSKKQQTQQALKSATNDFAASENASIRNGFNNTDLAHGLSRENRATPQPVMDEFNQSATEIATPTRVEFSNLPPFTKALDHVKAWLDAHREDPLASVEGNCEAKEPAVPPAPPVVHGSEIMSVPSANGDQIVCHDQPPKTDPNVAALSCLLPDLRLLISRLMEYPALRSSLEAHKHRLDALECASYSHGLSDELQEKFDMIDGRLTDLECKVEEHENLHANCEIPESDRSGHTLKQGLISGQRDGHSFSSNGTSAVQFESSSSSGAIAGLQHSGISDRIEDLGSRIQALESSAPPSYDNPYELEVIFLPWGPCLQGIWYSPEELSNNDSNRTAYTEEWANPQFRASVSSSGSKSRRSEYNGWDGDAIRRWADGTDEWLVPRATAPNSMIYRRLQSRGFVRNVQILGSTAKEVISAVVGAFGDMLDDHALGDQSNGEENAAFKRPKSHDSGTLLGLQAPFIPLRKVHKDSRLRFLGPDELVTPAVWTADFLSRTVVMRAAGGARRLFITNRNGYLQPSQSKSLHWTWQMLRELPRVHLDENGQEQEDSVPEADAKEACWQWDSRFDPPTSVVSSFSSDSSLYSTLSIRPSRLAQSIRSRTSPSSPPKLREPTPCGNDHAMPISPLSEFPVDRLGYLRRTNSASLCDSGSALSPTSKRRIAASQGENFFAKALPKRRRVSYSPTFIPTRHQSNAESWRLRYKSPSPFFSEVTDGRSQRALTSVKRGTTPFAYATPHSGPVAMVIEPLSDNGASGAASDNTEVLMESSSPKAEPEDDVWEGVVDEEASEHLEPHTDGEEDMLEYSSSLSEHSHSAYESGYDDSDGSVNSEMD